MNYFDLWEASHASYLAATFRSPRVRIGERFPPLRSRVGQWSKERLLYELAPGGFQAVDRDRVLTEELLKRSVTDDELLLLLKRREPDLSGTVLITIVSAHQVTRFVRVIREYLLTASGRDGKANAPFTIVGRTDEANFTDAAIEVLHHDNRANPAFQYAAAHGTSSTDYNALTELPRLDASYGREIYLAQMHRRLGLIADGEPRLAK